VNEREAQLLSEVETVRHEKEKELVSQKHHLEFLLVGIRESTQFGEVLVKEGSESEIVASQKEVVSRLTSLGHEKEKSQMEPATDSTIVFERDEGLRQVEKVIKVFGSVVSRDISAEKSSIEGQPSGSISINQAVSFKVTVVNKKGNRVTSSPKGKGIVPFVVEISLNGNQQEQVKIEEIEEKEGKFSVSFTLTTTGQHQISVSHKDRHFKKSPFRIDVFDRPLYRRDYNAAGTSPVFRFGSNGSEDGQFSYPHGGIACNLRGEIIVADSGNNRVQVFDKAGKFLFKFGSNGNGNGQFSNPYGVMIDQRSNQIVVADYSNNRVQIFDEKGAFIRVDVFSSESGEGQLSRPWGVAIDSQGNYFVAEQNYHRVSVFNSSGQFLRKFGSHGNGDGQLLNPRGLGLLSTGNVVVGEYSSGRISIFDSQGNFVRNFGVGQLTNPQHLFVDSDDNILVADFGNKRIQVFKSDGSLMKTVGVGYISYPSGVFIDAGGRILVCEVGTHRISIF